MVDVKYENLCKEIYMQKHFFSLVTCKTRRMNNTRLPVLLFATRIR